MLGPAKLIYRLALSLYQTGITLATPINPKAKAWVMGRKLQRKDPYKFPNGCIWVHCTNNTLPHPWWSPFFRPAGMKW